MSGAPTNSSDDDSAGRSIWTRPHRGTRGPAPIHGRDAIVAAAVELADAGGLGAVSMRAVATALGMAAGSLYRQLSSREDLLDLMVDRAVGELAPYPEALGSWLDELLLVARRQLALYRRHPWLSDAIGRRTAPGPNTLAYFDNCLRILQPLRCGAAAKFEAIAMVTGLVSLFARSEAASGSLAFDHVDFAAYPHLTAAFAAPASPAPRDDLFDRAVRGVLTALLDPNPA
ncbi:TetR/AcrR family transcriptional regulator [Micromonospora sp. SL4-19]|uniref:TetR/AcrR family transcriptional regulator n=1 Tax=Micromonospora sp. SL4-19 TaxID=3399129 RepID=UPI003A4D4522